MRKADDLSFEFITNEMAINLNVFGPLMESWIFCNPDDTGIIGIERGRTIDRKTKIGEQTVQPKNFKVGS